MENGTTKIGLRIIAGVLVAITVIVAVFASGITLPSQQEEETIKTGRLNVLLMDAPVDLDDLNLTITDVEVHKSGEDEEGGEWIALLQDEEITFDLLDYQNGATLDIASVDVPSGNYSKIRMFVKEANATYNDDPDTVIPLKVPSGKIDVITKFELEDGGTRTVLIDMEPDWIAISQSKNLRPVLKATISESPAESSLEETIDTNGVEE